MEQTEPGQLSVKFRWDLGQQAFGISSGDLQSTSPDGLQLAQQSLDLAFFAFGLPFGGQSGVEPVGKETEPHMIAYPVGAPVKDRPDLQILSAGRKAIASAFENMVQCNFPFVSG